MQIGDRVVRGEIRRREEAREEYERARIEGYQAALLEQERPNLFTQSVANLLPGEPIVVRLRTVETLAYERGTYRLTFPLVVGPRYVPGGGRVPDAAKVLPPALKPDTWSGHDVEIAVSLDAGVPVGTIESPSHRSGGVRSGARRGTVVLADADTIPNKDFLLRWSVASDDPAVGVLAHRDGVDGFFAFLVQPKAEVSAVEAAPKEITFVVDTWGSMSGIPIEASKRLIQKALPSSVAMMLQQILRGQNSLLARLDDTGEQIAKPREHQANVDERIARMVEGEKKEIEDVLDHSSKLKATGDAHDKIVAKGAAMYTHAIQSAKARAASDKLQFEEQLAHMPKETVLSPGKWITTREGMKLIPEEVRIKHKIWLLQPGVPVVVPQCVADVLRDRRKSDVETSKRKEMLGKQQEQTKLAQQWNEVEGSKAQSTG